jgi:alpha-galactosidase
MRIGFVFSTCLLAFAAPAAEPIAATPPMGWNSWDSYGTSVTEAEVKANADYMAAKLKAHGWQYIVVDIQWSDPHAKANGYILNAELTMDEFGRLIPAANRFPSGFKALGDYLHARGLKFGVHIMRGIPRRAVAANLPVSGSKVHAADIADTKSICTWNTDMYGVDMFKPGAQDYYDSILALYAEWGVDYIKCDDIAHPFHGDEIAAVHKAIVKTARPIVLSLSPGPADFSHAADYAANANLWRISNDLWDVWTDLRKSFDFLDKWSPFAKQGAWPDADMLPLGRIGIRSERGKDRRTRFTQDEQRTMMTLWCIARSPLMFGGDLPSNDAFTESLLTNGEVLTANQRGSNAHKLSQRGDAVIWTSDVGRRQYFAVFNLGEIPDLLITIPGEGRLRDVWEKKPVSSRTVVLPPHASALLVQE